MASRSIIRDWPRMMKRATAADYCDLTEAAFEREVSEGRLPVPVSLGGSAHWSRVAIDAALEKIGGEASADDWRKRSPLYAKQ